MSRRVDEPRIDEHGEEVHPAFGLIGATFVSSMNTGDGVPCTIRRREELYELPGLPHEPRLQESMDEITEDRQQGHGGHQARLR